MKFVADDGKIFETMDECEEYERMHNEGAKIARLWYNYVTVYDDYGRVTKPHSNFIYNLSAFWEELNEIISDDNKSRFIRIDAECEEEWVGIRDYFYNEYGYILPDYIGLWRYKDIEWVNFEEELQQFKENWAPVGIRIQRVPLLILC